MQVAIVGGGIGGLATALALHRVGIPSTVYEQAPGLQAVGAGIGLWPGALHALREIGVDDNFWELPVSRFRWARTATADGREVTGFDVRQMTRGDGYVVRRTDLQEALLAALPAGTVQAGRRLVTLRQDSGGVDLQFHDDTRVRADVVVGADGLRSAVRGVLLGTQPPRYSGQTAYRGIAALRVRDPGLMQETQSRGWRGAVHPLDPDHVYWWVARPAPPDLQEDPGVRKSVILEGVGEWVGGLPDAVSRTPADEILKNDLCDRDPVDAWSVGRVTLVGDAAHPTTPNLGLGGCMAIEDALVLARAVDEAGSYGPAFAQYEFERHARTARVVRMSRLMGRSGALTNPMAVAAWRAVNALTPSRVPARMLAREVTYEPGSLRR